MTSWKTSRSLPINLKEHILKGYFHAKCVANEPLNL